MALYGAEKADYQELPRIKERMSFIYQEYCRIERQDSAVVSNTVNGSIPIPVATISTLLLGPGTSITHGAIDLLADSGTTVIWTGEEGTRFYAYGRPLTQSSRLLESQARLVSNPRKRLAVARRMYSMRFPGEDVSRLTMQQLRGREGSRIRQAYKHYSEEYGVEWSGRWYKHDDFNHGNDVNKALSIANSCLYGAVQSAIVALGCSPGLGFVHVGHERSFVFDVADLYKTETTIPVAFKVVSQGSSNIYSRTRVMIRDVMVSNHIMERAAHDIVLLLGEVDVSDDEDVVRLLDENGLVESGTQYGD